VSSQQPRITICIPHWQVRVYMTLCLRSIRRHSGKYNLEVIVIDNGSRDDSLDYLRSLDWIRLIERPEEVHTNWPTNVFTAWDRGLAEATGEYFITMHSDVFVKQDGWLDPFLREITRAPDIAAAGAWKLELEHPLYAMQKQAVGFVGTQLKKLIGRQKKRYRGIGCYPRDYCAMYRRDILRNEALQFRPLAGQTGGGYSIAKQIQDAGYRMGMIPVREMAANIYHVAHGTAAVVREKPLHHQRAQRKVEQKVSGLFDEPWILALEADESLDCPRQAA